MVGQFNGLVQEGLVLDGPARFQAAGRGHDRPGFAVVDPDGELVGSEPAEHHRVDRTDPGACQHGDKRFRDHGHVDDDPVPGGNTLGGQGAGEDSHPVPQFPVGDLLLGPGDGAVVDNGELVPVTRFHVPVHGVVADIGLAAGKPAVVRRITVVQNRVPPAVPVYLFGGLAPEPLRVVNGAAVNFFKGVCHGSHPAVLRSPDASGRFSVSNKPSNKPATCRGGYVLRYSLDQSHFVFYQWPTAPFSWRSVTVRGSFN